MKSSIFLSIPALFLLLVGSAHAASFTLDAEADTYIRTDLDVRRNDNYGAQRSMNVGTGRGGNGFPGAADAMRSLVRFNTSGIPTEAVIESAFLALTIQSFYTGNLPTSNYKIDVHSILAPWIEGNGDEGAFPGSTISTPGSVFVDEAFGVAWEGTDDNNESQPPFNPEVIASASFNTSTKNPGDVILWDITSLVKDWTASGSSNNGIMLIDETTDGVFRELNFGTREGKLFNLNGAVNGPSLIVNVADGSTAVPEATTTLGILSLGAFMASSLKKRRQVSQVH